MIDWLKNSNKNSPEFWKTYLSKFDTKSNRYVVLCTETSGLNPKKDVILSFGAVSVIEDSIHIGDIFEVTIPQYKYLHDNGISSDFLLKSDKIPKTDRISTTDDAYTLSLLFLKLKSRLNIV